MQRHEFFKTATAAFKLDNNIDTLLKAHDLNPKEKLESIPFGDSLTITSTPTQVIKSSYPQEYIYKSKEIQLRHDSNNAAETLRISHDIQEGHTITVTDASGKRKKPASFEDIQKFADILNSLQ